MADRLAVHAALGERFVDGLHQASYLVIGLAGSLEEHRGRVIEFHGLIHATEQLRVLAHQLGNDVGCVCVGCPCGVGGSQDFLLDLRLLLQPGGGGPYLGIHPAELFRQGVELGQGEADADGSQHLRRHGLQRLDAVLCCLLRIFVDVVPQQDADVSYRQSAHPLRQFFGSPSLHVLVHAVESVELQSFIQGVTGLQLPHGGEAGLDEYIHPQLQLCEAAQVKGAVSSCLGVTFFISSSIA